MSKIATVSAAYLGNVKRFGAYARIKTRTDFKRPYTILYFYTPYNPIRTNPSAQGHAMTIRGAKNAATLRLLDHHAQILGEKYVRAVVLDKDTEAVLMTLRITPVGWVSITKGDK